MLQFIKDIIKEKETQRENFNRALNVSICPECGKNLMEYTEINTIAPGYTIIHKCNNPKCNFKHTTKPIK